MPQKSNDELQKTTLLKKAMLQALEKTLGVVTQACKIVNIHRATHYRWIKEDKEYEAEVSALAEVAKDYAETKLFKRIQKGDTTAILFYLKCKAKDRGYIDKLEIDNRNLTTEAIMKDKSIEELLSIVTG